MVLAQGLSPGCKQAVGWHQSLKTDRAVGSASTLTHWLWAGGFSLSPGGLSKGLLIKTAYSRASGETER